MTGFTKAQLELELSHARASYSDRKNKSRLARVRAAEQALLELERCPGCSNLHRVGRCPRVFNAYTKEVGGSLGQIGVTLRGLSGNGPPTLERAIRAQGMVER